MAILVSEDRDSQSSLEIIAGASQPLIDQTWQNFSLVLKSGDFNLTLGKGDSSTPNNQGCLFCRQPEDELGGVFEQLQELVDNKRDKLLFEPAEPSFELTITRSGAHGYKVEVWLDAGNAKTGIYRWDAAGVRFFTLHKHLVAFLEELKQQFLG
jgi:hypothetical protein